MIRIRQVIIALCLVLLALPALAGCGGGGEDWIVGEVVSVDQREAAIRPISPDEMEGVPYRKNLKDVERISFSTEIIDGFGAKEGDIVTVLFRGSIPSQPDVWAEALSWAPYSPEE